MPREKLYKPFEIEFRQLTHFPDCSYTGNFFKLIYILEGTGRQFTNAHHFQYRKGNLFLITPEDSYSFVIDTETSFFFLSFNDHYINPGSDREWVQRMDYILQNASHRPGCILKNRVDKPMVATLIDSILKENTQLQLYHEKIIRQLVNSLIILVARNIALKLPKNIKENTGEPVLDLLHYIQENILVPEMLRVEKMSRRFNISLNYLGRYFKHQTGETLQQYISNYKVRLVETRLLNTDMRINEIACELHYTDESHLNRTFKKYKKMTPSAFRKLFA